MRKPCLNRGCPDTADRGESYCPEHAPPPWTKQPGYSRPDGWYQLRRAILRRDRHECQTEITDGGLICGTPANEVDHVIPRFEGGSDHIDNLKSICQTHHLAKTKAESARARKIARL